MSLRWTVACLILFLSGFGLMVWSYHHTARAGLSFPLFTTAVMPLWGSAFFCSIWQSFGGR